MNNILPLFSVPFYHSKIIIDDDMKNFIYNLDFDRGDNGDFSLNTRILELPEMHILRQYIMSHIEIYAKEILRVNNDVYITNSWVVRHHKGDWAANHIHSNSIFSGVVYIDTEPNSGQLVVHKNFVNITPKTISLDFNDWNLYNSDLWRITPEPNDIVIFPSTLNHSVTQSQSDNKRFCLAFNTFVRGKLGSIGKYEISDLTL